jgi:hypothetical protein
MTEFVTDVVAITIKYADAHSDHIHEPSQIFRPVADKTLTQDVLRAADELILEKIQGLRSSPVTIQKETGTIVRRQFLN